MSLKKNTKKIPLGSERDFKAEKKYLGNFYFFFGFCDCHFFFWNRQV